MPFISEEHLQAVRTRLGLATSGVTGRYSNQLNYRTSISTPLLIVWDCKYRYNLSNTKLFFHIFCFFVERYPNYSVNVQLLGEYDTFG